jgi:hypothetical protein
VPVLIESLLPPQHQSIEDIAHAVLHLQGGDLTLIRQGVRERGNIIRELIPFRIVRDEETGKDEIEIVQEEDEQDQTSEFVKESPTVDGASALSVTETKSSLAGKITLQLEEDEPKQARVDIQRQPRIFIQQDDPEYHDLDEEDPDDDLDI